MLTKADKRERFWRAIDWSRKNDSTIARETCKSAVLVAQMRKKYGFRFRA